MDIQEAGKGYGRVIRIALVLSLALNVIVMGVVLGAVFGGHPMRPGLRSDVGFGPLTAGLSRADRKALRARFEAAAPDFRAGRRASEQDFRAFAALLQADDWDRAAAEGLLAQQGARMAERLAVGRSILLDYVADMSPEDRRALGARIARALHRRAE